jgi:predicted RNA-binding protein associated with RNAse of E/G family
MENMPTQIYEHYEIIDIYEPGPEEIFDEDELLMCIYDGLVGECLAREAKVT